MSLSSYEVIWKQVLDQIENTGFFTEDTFRWIKNTTLFKIENKTAYVAYRFMVTKTILNKDENKEMIASVLSEIINEDVSLQLIQYKDMEKLMPEEEINERTSQLLKTTFNEEYTFENFVEGKSNQEAYAACLACCNQRGAHTFNPILIYGNSGLGKTHLLHAIGNYLKKERPEYNVFYSYSGDLVTILINAMTSKTVHGNMVDKVKSMLVNNDYFLIDDIQNLNRESSQEIFFTVYNELISKGAQIVITSDMHPNELNGLLPTRLVSRFNAGLSINIGRPEFETSKAILKKKIEGNEETCQIEEEVLDYLAQKFSNDVRNLEGSLNRLIFNATLENPEVIDLSFAQRILMNEVIVNENDELTIKKIKKAVTRFYGLTYKDIEGKSRQKKLMNARHVFVYLSRELLHKAYISIGQELGNRDHTTISSSYERACQLIKNDINFKTAVEKVQEMLEKK